MRHVGQGLIQLCLLQVFSLERRNSMDYHVMTKELYPHGYLLETRGFFANDKAVRTLSTACPLHVISVSVHSWQFTTCCASASRGLKSRNA